MLEDDGYQSALWKLVGHVFEVQIRRNLVLQRRGVPLNRALDGATCG